jgi:hypothetical protein
MGITVLISSVAQIAGQIDAGRPAGTGTRPQYLDGEAVRRHSVTPPTAVRIAVMAATRRKSRQVKPLVNASNRKPSMVGTYLATRATGGDPPTIVTRKPEVARVPTVTAFGGAASQKRIKHSSPEDRVRTSGSSASPPTRLTVSGGWRYDRRATAARAHLSEALELLQAAGDLEKIAGGHDAAAAVAATQGDPVAAARGLGAAEAMRERIGAPLAAAYRADHDRQSAAARAVLGEATFAAAWAVGRALPLADAIAEARQPAA